MKTILLFTLSMVCNLAVAQNCFKVYVKYDHLVKNIDTRVGNEYEYWTKIAGVGLDTSEKVEVKLCKDQEFDLSACARDVDPVYDDDNCEFRTIKHSHLKPGEFSLTIDVIVRENAGRYAGLESNFKFEYRIYVYAN